MLLMLAGTLCGFVSAEQRANMQKSPEELYGLGCDQLWYLREKIRAEGGICPRGDRELRAFFATGDACPPMRESSSLRCAIIWLNSARLRPQRAVRRSDWLARSSGMVQCRNRHVKTTGGAVKPSGFQ